MAKVRVAVCLLLVVLALTLRSLPGYSDPRPPADPCEPAATVTKSSVPLTGTGGELIPASSQSVHICGFTVSPAPEGGGFFKFVYGTGSACSVGTVPLTGFMTLGSQVTPFAYSGPGTIFSVPAGSS